MAKDLIRITLSKPTLYFQGYVDFSILDFNGSEWLFLRKWTEIRMLAG